MVRDGEDVDAAARCMAQELSRRKGAVRCVAVRVQIVDHFAALYVLAEMRKVLSGICENAAFESSRDAPHERFP